MRRILAGLILAIAACLTASATSTTISGTKTYYPIGFPLASGTFTFNGVSAPITNGAFSSSSFSEGTSSVVISTGNQVILTIPNVTINTTTYNWDNYLVAANALISGMGSPTIACNVGAFFLQTDSVQYGQPWTCQSFQGQSTWLPQGPPGVQPTGRYSAAGAPAFACYSPCQYTQTDAAPTSAATWVTLAARGFPTSTWALQSGQIATGVPFLVSSGCGVTGAVQGGTLAGTFTAGQTSCAAVITPGFNALHGFLCQAWDVTTSADSLKQTATSTSSCTVSGTVASSDVIGILITAY